MDVVSQLIQRLW